MKKNIFTISLIILSLTAGAYGWQTFGGQGAVAQNLVLDEQEATIRAIQKVSPAVVSILVYDYQDRVILTPAGHNAARERILAGTGTGFIISKDGYIITNKHVVQLGDEDTAEYQIIFNNDKKYYAQRIGLDPILDLGILKIFDKDLPAVELGDSDKLVQGTTVVAIGNALGKYQNTATKGIISALGRSLTASDHQGNKQPLDNIIQTDAEINEGNSGGPLINLYGQVVGINTAVDKSGSNIGFAIPINDARVIIKSIQEQNRIVRPYIGVRYIMLTPEIAQDYGLSQTSGAFIIKGDDNNSEPGILPNSPAAAGGLKEGDIILEINAIKIEGNNTLFNMIQKYKPGNRIGLRVLRGQEIVIIIVTLGEFK